MMLVNFFKNNIRNPLTQWVFFLKVFIRNYFKINLNSMAKNKRSNKSKTVLNQIVEKFTPKKEVKPKIKPVEVKSTGLVSNTEVKKEVEKPIVMTNVASEFAISKPVKKVVEKPKKIKSKKLSFKEERLYKRTGVKPK